MQSEAASDLSGIFAAAERTLGLRLADYRSRQLERRLTYFRQRHGLQSNAEVAARLYSDPEFRRQFADFVTINVSEFFRNPERYADLRRLHLPALLAGRPGLQVWSAGCSIGAEPYSLAILLHELAPAGQHVVLGTDIDAASLERCRAGVYRDTELREVPAAMRHRYFQATQDGWRVDPAVRSLVSFRRLDLLVDPFPTGQDLIACRNVVIYFTDAAKLQLYRRFRASLRPGGLLFVGATESIFDCRTLGFEYVAPCFYRATPGGGGA